MKIRGQTISYSAYKKPKNNEIQKKLSHDIKELEENLNINRNLLEEEHNELTEIRGHKTKGHLTGARAQWIEKRKKAE